ncbi:hypothetical protein CsSME_00050380 [Camellia sinensis var. sinensis]
MKDFINNGDLRSHFDITRFLLLGQALVQCFLPTHLLQLSPNPSPLPKPLPPISLSSNLNKTFDLNSLVNNTIQTQPLSDPTLLSIPSTSHPKPLPPSPQERFGIVDENGMMPDDFEVGDFDPSVVDNWGSDFFSPFFFRHLNT